ncbi:MAG: galactokinase family protein, partial [Gaiellaceae bacterium]
MATTTPGVGRSTRRDPGDAESFCLDVGSSAFFASGIPVTVARAPGRLDVLGGISDYSGGLVLELPLRVAALAAAQ